MSSLPHLALLELAVAGTSFLSGIFGMAGGMVLMGILLAIMPLAMAMTLHAITQMASNGWRAWLWREHIRWRPVAAYASGAAVAVGAFALYAMQPSKAQALLILGLTPLAGLLLPRQARLNAMRPAHGVACGAVCMSLQLLAGVSGPMLDVFYVHSGLDRRAIVATKATVQTMGHALKLAYFGTLLALDGEALSPILAAMTVLVALGGTHASRTVLDRMSDTQFLTWSRRLIVVVAGAYLAQGTFLLARAQRGHADGCASQTCISQAPTARDRDPSNRGDVDAQRPSQRGKPAARPARASRSATQP
ncbi:MAG TPA: sulfite exporter TauE/SafE family protein [Casimicrobiaceae bacterium]|nr:sulfite exporter TauE/SafE family protein [Casimicrobiaceae bacterium]